MIKKWACILALTSFGVSAESIDPVGIDFNNYFSATCRTQGTFTQKVLADSQSLITIINNIKTDPNCATVAGAVGQLENLQARLVQLDTNDAVKVEIERLTAQESELFQLLSQASDDSERYDINYALREVQIAKAGLIAEENSKDSIQGENVRNVYAKIVAASNSFFNTISSNQLCLQKNPNLLSSVTSLTGAIASTVAYANPALGLGVAAGTDFIGRAIENLRNRKYNKMIRKVSDSSFAVTGFQCALESLSYRWCEQDDALKLVDLKQSVRNEPNEELGFQTAFKVIDRDIPVLVEWLTKVRAGVPATTSADAGRQEAIYYRQASVQAAEAKGFGVIAENRPLFNIAEDTQDKWSVVRNVIGDLTGKGCGNGSSGTLFGPLNDIYNTDFSAFYLLGLESIPSARVGGEQPADFCSFNPLDSSQWPIPNSTYVPDLNQVQHLYQEWVAKARARVDAELTIVTQPDALKVLSTVYEPTGTLYKYDPMTAIKTLKEFLGKYKPKDFINSSFRKIYQDTFNKLSQLIEVIDGAVVGDAYPDPTQALIDIFRITDLQYGAIVLQSRLEMIARISITEYLSTLDPKESNIAAQLLAADSFLDALQKISGGNSNLSLIKADILGGLDVSQSNMKNFVEIFGAGINQILKSKYEEIRSTNDEELNRASKRVLANYCLLLSSMPKWPVAVDQSYCIGTQIQADKKGGPTSPVITKEYLKSSFSKRKCGLRDFYRKSKIYADWDISLKK